LELLDVLVALPLIPAFNMAISKLDSTLCFSRTYDLIARNEAAHTQANENAGFKIPGHAGGILILMRNDVTFCLG
jgi:hypothetical protein